MKNFMIAAVLSLGTMTAFAQEENAVEEATTAVEETATEAVEETATEAVEETATEATEAVEETATDATEAAETTQGDFAEVAAEELPESVTSAVSKNYPTASIDKAYVNEANQYKLEVSLEDGTAGTLYADENGNWIEM